MLAPPVSAVHSRKQTHALAGDRAFFNYLLLCVSELNCPNWHWTCSAGNERITNRLALITPEQAFSPDQASTIRYQHWQSLIYTCVFVLAQTLQSSTPTAWPTHLRQLVINHCPLVCLCHRPSCSCPEQILCTASMVGRWKFTCKITTIQNLQREQCSVTQLCIQWT